MITKFCHRLLFPYRIMLDTTNVHDSGIGAIYMLNSNEDSREMS